MFGIVPHLISNQRVIFCSRQLEEASILSPEILTFDELFYRPACIAENISREVDHPRPDHLPPQLAQQQ